MFINWEIKNQNDSFYGVSSKLAGQAHNNLYRPGATCWWQKPCQQQPDQSQQLQSAHGLRVQRHEAMITNELMHLRLSDKRDQNRAILQTHEREGERERERERVSSVTTLISIGIMWLTIKESKHEFKRLRVTLIILDWMQRFIKRYFTMLDACGAIV